MSDDLQTPPEVKWALFDEKGDYRGGVCTLGKTPSADGSNPEGFREERVVRFPEAHESWDSTRRVWVGDEGKKKERERDVDLTLADHVEFRKLVLHEVQETVYEALKVLIPEKELTKEQVADLFPMLGEKP